MLPLAQEIKDAHSIYHFQSRRILHEASHSYKPSESLPLALSELNLLGGMERSPSWTR